MSITEQVKQLKKDFDEVYEAGYNMGQSAGGDTDAAYQQGVTDGKKAEYDKMWDVVQNNGTATYVTTSGYFNGKLWNYYNFYPKYDIKPTGSCAQLFYAWEWNYCDTTLDLKQRLIDCGVELDTRNATNISSMFNYSRRIHNIPTIDCTGLTSASTGVFANTYANPTIEKIIVNETVTYQNWFNNATGLTNITFEGVIGQSINFNWSTNLSVASMKSIISCLKNLTGTEGEGVYSIQFSSDCWNALEADSTAPDGGTWQNYVSMTLGWSI